MILVNGAIGIGTGYSTNIPQFNPEDIINIYLENIEKIKLIIGNILTIDDIDKAIELIDDEDIREISPYYLGFKGSIEKNEKGSYISKGIYKWLDNTTLEITELPIGTWTENYKEFLEDLIIKNNQYLKTFESHYTAKNVKFILKIVETDDKEKVIKELNLTSTKNLSLNNLHMFTHKGNIKKYENISEILIEWFKNRIYKYHTRKETQLNKMKNEFLIISNKIRFILDVIEGNILIMNKKLKEIEEKLEERKYDRYEKSYNYLLQLPISQLTADKKEQLEKDVATLELEIKNLEETSIIKIWEDELNELLKEWIKYKTDILEDYENDLKGDLKKIKKSGKK